MLAGYLVLIAVSLAQALAGRAPFELVAPAALVFWTSVAVVVAAFAATAAGTIAARLTPSFSSFTQVVRVLCPEREQ